MALALDSSGFDRKSARYEADLLASSEVALSEFAGQAAVRLQRSTPPFKGGSRDNDRAAWNRGRNAITTRFFQFAEPSGDDAPAASVVFADWRSVQRGGAKRKVRASTMQDYLEKAFSTIGHAAGGWNTALDQLGFGTEIASFTRAAAGAGSFAFSRGANGVSIRFSNDVAYLADLDGVPARLDAALAALIRESGEKFEKLLLDSAQKSGFRI